MYNNYNVTLKAKPNTILNEKQQYKITQIHPQNRIIKKKQNKQNQ